LLLSSKGLQVQRVLLSPIARANLTHIAPDPEGINELRVAKAVVHWRQAGRPSERNNRDSKAQETQAKSAKVTNLQLLFCICFSHRKTRWKVNIPYRD
jgi:hypothetical protein